MLVLVSLVLGFAMLNAFGGFVVMVTFDAYEAMFGCNHLEGISGCRFALCISFPFSALCDVMLAMLVCATRWLSMHLYTLAYMFMHESCLLVCRPCFNTMELWTFDPSLHLSLVNTTFCCFFACLLSCPLAFLFVCLSLFVMSLSHAMHIVSILLVCFAPFAYYLCISFFPLLVYWFLVFAYPCTHIARTLGARAWSPRCKRKGRKVKHVDLSQEVAFSRFRSLVFPFGYVLF